MKSGIIILLLSLFLCCEAAHAQFEKFSWMASGINSLCFSTGCSATKQDGTKLYNGSVLNLYLRTGPGIFLLEQMALGLTISTIYNHSKYAYSDGSDDQKYVNNSLDLAIGPFLRYYFWRRGPLLTYAEVLFAYGVYNTVYKSYETSKTVQRLMQFQLMIGLNYFLASNLALDFGLGYILKRYNEKAYSEIQTYNQFIACLGITFFFCRNAGLKDFK